MGAYEAQEENKSETRVHSALDLNYPWTRNCKRLASRLPRQLVTIDRRCIQLVDFLRDKNPAVRQIALEHLLGHTPKGSPSRSLFLQGLPDEPDAVRSLKILCRDQVVRTSFLSEIILLLLTRAQ